MIVAVDFDGTIVKEDAKKFFETGGTYIGKVLSGAIKFLEYLQEQGHSIVIYTARMNPDQPQGCIYDVDWFTERLFKMNIPFDEVWCEEGKPFADVFIDDRALSFNGDWLETWGEFMELEKKC